MKCASSDWLISIALGNAADKLQRSPGFCPGLLQPCAAASLEKY
jgi:hypothetical protein